MPILKSSMRSKTKHLTHGAMIAVLYVILTYISMAMGMDKGIIQCRLSEILTVLPVFFPSAVPGLFVGCILANTLTGCAFWDIVFGSLATLSAAFVTSKLKKAPYLAALPPIIINTAVIPLVLAYIYKVQPALPLIALSVFAAEVVSAGILGTLLILTIRKVS